MKTFKLIAILSTLFSNLTASLTLEQQIGQLLIPYIDGECVSESTYAFLRTHQPSGVLLYNWANKLDSPEQVKALASGLQNQAAELELLPLFICTDQEGGLVARLRQGFTEFPGNAALGRADSEELAFLLAREMALEALEVGVNFIFAPVVDINSNPDNPVIGIRSYGDNPELVTRLGLAASQGFSEGGIISCLKHFPGHGDVNLDSHESLPILEKSREELEAMELVPFQTILNHSPAIMTAHLRIPQLDAHRCATVSRAILTHLLREELGYEGLIVTDSLTMGAVIEQCGDIGEAAVQAFEAGADLLVIGEHALNSSSEPIHDRELARVQKALLQAVHEGRITTDRLQDSLNRIFRTKNKFRLGRKPVVRKDKDLAQRSASQIAEKAVWLEKGGYSPLLCSQNVAIIAPQVLQEAIETSGLPRIGRQCQCFYFEGFDPTPQQRADLEGKLGNTEAIIFFSYNAWRFPQQEALLRGLSQRYPLTLIAARDSRDALLGTDATTVVTTVSPTATAFSVVLGCVAKLHNPDNRCQKNQDRKKDSQHREHRGK